MTAGWVEKLGRVVNIHISFCFPAQLFKNIFLMSIMGSLTLLFKKWTVSCGMQVKIQPIFKPSVPLTWPLEGPLLIKMVLFIWHYSYSKFESKIQEKNSLICIFVCT